MNWDAISTIAEIVGAIAVVVTLWYLANQMRQSAQQAQADNLQRAVYRWIDIQTEHFRTPESATLIQSALNNYEEISSVEKMTFHGFMAQLVSCFHTILALYQRQLWSEKDFATVERDMVGFLKCPGALAWWKEVRFSFPGELAQHLDQAMAVDQNPPFTQSVSFFQLPVESSRTE